MSFQEASEAPAAVLGGNAAPKLSIRNSAKTAKIYQDEQTQRLRKLADEEKMTPDARARFIALNVTADYGRGHLWDWSMTFHGAAEICEASLIQGGKTAAEAKAIVESLSTDFVIESAMEIVGHPGAPSKTPKKGETENPQ